MNKSIVTGFLIGSILTMAVGMLFLPIKQEKLVLDGQSLKAILRAHEYSYDAFILEQGEVTLPSKTVQFLETFNVEVTESGDRYTVRYLPRDLRTRGGGYVVELRQSDGELLIEDYRIER
jgi:hypothetical protein